MQNVFYREKYPPNLKALFWFFLQDTFKTQVRLTWHKKYTPDWNWEALYNYYIWFTSNYDFS